MQLGLSVSDSIVCPYPGMNETNMVRLEYPGTMEHLLPHGFLKVYLLPGDLQHRWSSPTQTMIMALEYAYLCRSCPAMMRLLPRLSRNIDSRVAWCDPNPGR